MGIFVNNFIGVIDTAEIVLAVSMAPLKLGKQIL
jgi:hypothetical protein